MYQNFSSFLNNSLRILNIANRVIPLVRDMNPQIIKIRNTIKNMNSTLQSSIPTNNNPVKELPYTEQRVQNNLTFFR